MNFGILYRPITGFFVSLRRIKQASDLYLKNINTNYHGIKIHYS